MEVLSDHWEICAADAGENISHGLERQMGMGSRVARSFKARRLAPKRAQRPKVGCAHFNVVVVAYELPALI